MIAPADAAALLPPTFQVLTGLSFLAVLAIRFGAASALRPLWGKLLAFSVVFVALGNFLMSLATAKPSLAAGAEFFTCAGVSYFVAVLLVVAGMMLVARRTAVAVPS